jgi:hypothetical protein
MAERRGMGEAMALTPEKMAFIQGGALSAKPIPKVATSASPVEPLSAEPVPSSPEATPEPLPVTRGSSSRPSRSRRSTASAERTYHEQVEEGGYGEILVPLTTRLKPRTADALRRVCLEQKLARRTPNSQQEIVELALAEWLENQGFSR